MILGHTHKREKDELRGRKILVERETGSLDRARNPTAWTRDQKADRDPGLRELLFRRDRFDCRVL